MGTTSQQDLTRAATQIAAQQYGVLSLKQAHECGLQKVDLRRLRRRGTWGRPYPGVYSVRCLLDFTSESQRLRRIVMGVQLCLGPAACASAETAARLWELQGLPPWDGKVHMNMPGSTSQVQLPGVEIHQWETRPDEITRQETFRVTTPGRTLRDVALRLDRDAFVSLLDSALNQGYVQHPQLPSLEAANQGRRGCRACRPYWQLANGRAQSPLETRIRLICVDGGMPPDELQHPFYLPEEDRTVYGDLWWEDRRLLVEADGVEPHSRPGALLQDRRRQNALLRAYPGIRIVRFTWNDLAHPAYILGEIARASA